MMLRFQHCLVDFSTVLRWVAQHARKLHPQSRLLVLCFSEAIYGIWLQRNSKVFNSSCKEVDVLFRDVFFHVLCRSTVQMKDWLFSGM